MITVYQTGRRKHDISIHSGDLVDFLGDPSLSTLIRILKGNDDVLKKAILTSLNCSVNYTSVKPFVKNDVILFNLLNGIDLNPIYNEQEIKAIMEYIRTKSNTSVIAKHQIDDITKFFNTTDFEFVLSTSGSTDIDFNGRKAAAKSDGLVKINGHDVIIYLRYGSSSGGSQNDRWRGMFSIASRHKDKMFLFIVDGVEALQQYNLCKDEFEKDSYPNAIWSTAKYLHFINFDNLKDCR